MRDFGGVESELEELLDELSAHASAGDRADDSSCLTLRTLAPREHSPLRLASLAATDVRLVDLRDDHQPGVLDVRDVIGEAKEFLPFSN